MRAVTAVRPSARTAPSIEGWERRVRRISACRICRNPALMPVIALGSQCLASLFDDGKPRNQLTTPIPLEVVRCDTAAAADACGFVQLTHTVPPDVLYHDYGYRSGINTTMRRHLETLAQDIESSVPLERGDIVIDIGANDGVTLLAYRNDGIVRVGFEPSNIRPEGTGHGLIYIPTIFNPEEFHARFPGKTARVITSIAMFYDLDDPLQFCLGVHEILSNDGVWVLEMSSLGAMLDHNSFDAICHEHLGYYSLQTLEHVIRRAGFVFYDLTLNQANGGSLRCSLKKERSGLVIPSVNRARVDEAFREERERGFHDPRTFARFRSNVERIKAELLQQLEADRRQGRRVFGYGASTKGNVLLQYVGIGPQHLVAIADRNPAKVGRKTLGTKIPICAEAEMRAASPEALLILPWHFLEEFLEREGDLRASGTRFIVPFPSVHVV